MVPRFHQDFFPILQETGTISGLKCQHIMDAISSLFFPFGAIRNSRSWRKNSRMAPLKM